VKNYKVSFMIKYFKQEIREQILASNSCSKSKESFKAVMKRL